MMEDNYYKTIKWDDADKIMKNLVGCPIKQLPEIVSKQFSSLKSLYTIANWENKSDIEIINIIQNTIYLSNSIYIITDISYINNVGIFNLEMKDINRFIRIYFSLYSECLFNGDVFFISITNKNILMFQHDGKLISYNLPLSYPDIG